MRRVRLAFAVVVLGAASAPGQALDLSGPWRYHTGDDLSWSETALDDSAWPTIAVPTGWGRTSPVATMAWYRRHLVVDRASALTPPGLAILISNVDSAYTIYAGGRLLGGVGALPPDAKMDYDRRGLFVLPPAAVGPDGTIVLALRVWKSPDTESSIGGPVEGQFLLGPALELQRQVLLGEMVQLFLAVLFLLVSLYHFHLFHRRAMQSEYFWYALVALDAGLYCLLRTQWKYALTDRFVLLKEAEYVVLLTLPALFVQFVWPLVGERITWPLRVHQAWNVGLALVVAGSPGLWLNQHVLPYWEVGLLPLVAAAVFMLARSAWRGHPEGRTIAVGLSVFMLFALHDVAVDRGLATTPRVTAFGFAALVLSMAMSLVNRFSRSQVELAALGRDLERRVNERTEELSRRTAEASAANVAKSRFLATMSHEIRTPLNAVIGMTGLVLDSPLDEEQRESLEIARRSGESLLELVNDILDFSKIESERLELEAQPFALRTCMEDALEVMAGRAAEKGLDLACLAADDVPPLVRGDVTRVRQVLVNLVGNAVKFTATGGVLVSAERHIGPEGVPQLHVAVRDTGIGIPRDRRGALFQPFSQVDASHSREYGGSGLGLAISHRLCELMGGTLWLDDGDGPGSVFHFTFAAEPVEGGVPAELQASPPELAGRKALIVGAGPFTLQTLETRLRFWGLVVESVSAEDEATRVVGLRSSDVALIGFGFSEHGDGTRTLERLRDLPADERPGFVAFGPLTVREQLARVAQPSRFARLVLPMRGIQLHAALLEALGLRQAAPLTAEPKPLRRSSHDARRLRILLAEDNVVNQKVALQMLARLGYRADVAGNGLEVLEALGRQPYDLILLDVQMPEMDGLETARRVRAQWNPGPRLVAMTANALLGDREACLAAGMDDYLSKPVSSADLAAALERCWPQEEAQPPKADSPTPAATSEVLASEALERLRQLEDEENPDFVADLIRDFIQDTQPRLESLRVAAAAGDRQALELVAHSLKGSAGMLGGRRLEATCLVLEQAAHVGPPPDLPDLLARIEADFETLRERLLAFSAAPRASDELG
jgi:signal transduction histidine kinase/CheY-like chemotaxis protein/HPt (histidine-containing phosphotransfer) domain-containing protein